MTTEQQYAKVSAICGDMAAYSGTYYALLLTGLVSGEKTKAEFTEAMRAADVAFSEGIAQLKTVRFPHMAQRRALTKLVSGLQTYRRGIGAAITAVEKDDAREWRRVERYFDQATEACMKYYKFTAQDLMKGVGTK
ncbi:hypothetical protein [Paenibacillus sp. PL91]|uniref:hypothetical protein n=1 Tax=Paenibacillus sp. PL91 TaxID=2729538 RepID=UPI00145E4920|nr:hypothetical protein [Paenibacillus sp. PL91]MBC9199763.1 hypothetical protein [Paenibacillus sp. PL91]